MEKKIRAVSSVLIAVILMISFSAICVVRGQSVKAVYGVAMKDNSNSSITVSWNKVKKADGYYLYNYDKVNDTYEKLAAVSGEDTCSYKLDDLSGATTYNLKVFAYKNFLNKEYKSEEAQQVVIYTLPDALVTIPFSGNKGVLSVEWETDDKLSGYDIQYSLSKDFKDAKTVHVTENTTRNTSIEGLNPGDTYYVRGRSYITVGKEKIYGDWGKATDTVINKKDLNIGHINPNKPMVAFSFDDGPAFTYKGSNSTARILDVLEKYGARATFFMVGERVDSDTKSLLQREIAIGCELGNHTYNHNHYGNDVTPSDIKRASDRIKEYSGKAPTIFRCPGGNLTSDIRNQCKKEGMPLAYWSVDTLDWKTKNAKSIYNNVINQAYDGAIILMHDIYPTTADAVEKIVPELISKGYQIVTVSELIKAKTGEEPKAGQQYVDYETINNHTR